MGPWLTKLATALLLPLSLGLALLLAAVILVAVRRTRLGLTALCAAFLWLWLCSMGSLADHLAASLEGRFRPLPVEQEEPADAIVVLGGSTSPRVAPRVTVDLSGSGDRLLQAARLFRAGKAPVIVVSGGIVDEGDAGIPEAISMTETLVELGVPRSAILLESESHDTHENCREVATLLEQRGIEEVLLVTSAVHMRRALATCRSAGMRARPSPTDYRTFERPLTLLDWTPKVSALARTTRALREYLATQLYIRRGWIDPRHLDLPAPTPSAEALEEGSQPGVAPD
jgi:uncharacterized SAM-binding protein YcdF (DUF218 family)